MKKHLTYIFLIIFFLALFSPLKHAAAVPCTAPGTPPGCIDPNYKLLAPLPCENGTPGCESGKLETFNPKQANNLGFYLNIMIKIIIGLAAVLSVIMIVIGGVEYMTSELSHSKEGGKERMTHAILGLLLAIGAYALLFTINPDLLNSDPTAKISATNPTTLGTCRYPLANGGSATRQNISQQECNNLIVAGGGGFGSSSEGWTPNP